MKILVFVKQVPDTDDVKLDPKTGNIMREGVASKLNPLDANAVEAAIQLKEKYGAQVCAISMGPPQAEDVLKKALALGCDEAYLLSDRAFGGADTADDAFANARKDCLLASATYELLYVGTHRDACLCDKLDSVFRYGGNGRRVDNLRVYACLYGLEYVASSEVYGGCFLKCEVDVRLVRRYESVDNALYMSARHVVGFKVVARNIA